MKKTLYGAALLALGLGMASCDQLHNDLRLEVPTNYILETPEGADQLVIFGTTGSNVNNELDVVTYNPYNINTTVDFQVQVGRSESDFETWDNLVSSAVGEGESNYDFTNSDGLPYVVTISNTYTSPTFTMPGADFCEAINQLYGFETEEQCQEPVQVAYRVHAWVPGVEYSSIFSNVVTLPKVQTYIPLRAARKLYLIGAPQGWDINSDAMAANETEIGSNIYKGTFNVANGQFIFRFYSELGDWETNSYGSQEEDNPIEIEVTNDTYSGEVVVGKGSWQYTGWEGGSIDVTIDLNNYVIDMVLHPGEEGPETPDENVLYLIGQPQGWNIAASDMVASEISSGVYRGTFEIAEGEFQFRFYSALGDWETNSIGSQDEDAPVAISLASGSYTGPVVRYDEATGVLGKGTWQDTEWAGGWVEITINLNDNTIQMNKVSEPAKYVDIYIRGGMNDWGTSPEYQFSATADENVWVINSITIEAGVEFKIADSNWNPIDLGGAEGNSTVNPGMDFTLTHGGTNLTMSQSFTGSATLTKNGDSYSILFE